MSKYQLLTRPSSMSETTFIASCNSKQAEGIIRILHYNKQYGHINSVTYVKL
jgi:hypothetical protein